MDKTIKINLGGILFQIDEDAYQILRRYLQEIDNRLKNTPGGAETIEDIESRIAEIFQSQGGTAGVISRENVEMMMKTVGRPEDFDTSAESTPEQGTSYRTTTGRKKMYRNPDDIIIGGVCSGIGEYVNLDAVWIRLLFILFTCFFGIGFFVYIALWIALPSASTDEQKREMYGRDDYYSELQRRKASIAGSDFNRTNGSGRPAGSSVGNAFNEVFRALGKVFYIVVRIFLIMIGLVLVVSGFLMLVSFVMVFFFNYPDYFSTHSFGVNLFYLPDFLNYIVNPAIAPWILILTFIVILMPLLAIIYWGVKMIFWFRARDGVFGLAGLVIWVICVAALSILLFNEGISFSETAKTFTEKVVDKAPSVLYIKSLKKTEDLKYDKEISFDEDNYNVYFSDDNKNLNISSNLIISRSDDKSLKVTVKKRSAGRSRSDALRKAERLQYDFAIKGDTVFLDEYFTIPSGQKWSVDDIWIDLYIPEGTRIIFDNTTEKMYANEHNYDEWGSDSEGRDYVRSSTTGDSWIMTGNGLKRAENKE